MRSDPANRLKSGSRIKLKKSMGADTKFMY